jgi:multicomponent K+:H+ antiporter subunit E
MLRRLLPHPLLTLVLTLTWLLLVNSFTIGQALLGLLLGLVIPVFTRHFWPDPVRIARPWWLVFFLLKVLWDILVANVAVAALILGGRRFACGRPSCRCRSICAPSLRSASLPIPSRSRPAPSRRG